MKLCPTLCGIHDNARYRTVVRIARWVLVWVRHTRNVLVYNLTHGAVVGETTIPMAHYAPGRVASPPYRVDGTAGGDDE